MDATALRHEWDTWNRARDKAAFGPFGVASLASTNWLDATPRPIDEAPGLWRTDGTLAVSDDLDLALAPGDDARHGDILLRGMARDGQVAVRVFTPHAAAARGVSGIERFAFDPAMRVIGRFTASDDSPSPTLSVDHHSSATVYAGTIALTLPAGEVSLTVERTDDGGLFAAFADGTAGTESHRFRFLRMPAPDTDGTVIVDFTRAYLPPCAFSDHYVCVFPPPANRFSVPVRAGERDVR